LQSYFHFPKRLSLKSLDGEVPKSKKLTIYINDETMRGVIQMERSIVIVNFI